MNRCPHCAKTFSQPRALHRHVKGVHEKHRPHACQQCDQRFFERYRLALHHRTVHLQERPFPCAHCSRSFADSGNRNRHIATMHASIDGDRETEALSAAPPAPDEQAVSCCPRRRVCKRKRISAEYSGDEDACISEHKHNSPSFPTKQPIMVEDALAQYTTEEVDAQCEADARRVTGLFVALHATRDAGDRQQLLSRLRAEALASALQAISMRLQLEQLQRQHAIAAR